MDRLEPMLRPPRRIRRGAHPPHRKNTAACESVVMPPPAQVVIAMQQHIGAACIPCVQKGDLVFVGTLVGDSDRLVGAPIHASVSGVVSDIKTVMLPNGGCCQAVVIDSDGKMTPDPSLRPPVVETAEDLAAAARQSGLVGLGGAGFPAHVKLKRQPDKPLDTLIVNGAECEPYITADYRECLEASDDILEGIYRLKALYGFERVIIAIEDNKPQALRVLRKIASDKRDAAHQVNVMRLTTRYPQGAEKVLIYTTTGRKVPAGKLPADVGCVVMNIQSVAFLNRYIKTGMPLVSKRLTVDGGAVAAPQNVIVPIGTPIRDVLDFCGGAPQERPVKKILMGGPMMGLALADDALPVLKQNNAILALDEAQAVTPQPTPCISCGRCARVCPMRLAPAAVERALSKNAGFEGLHVDYCMECGSCAFVCPARRPLAQVMRLAKAAAKKMGTKE